MRRIGSDRQFVRHRQRNPSRRSDGHSAAVMANTPSVVPIARTYRCAVVTPSTVGCVGPGIAAKIAIVAITMRLFRIGANIGTANRRCEFSRPVATAPIP